MQDELRIMNQPMWKYVHKEGIRVANAVAGAIKRGDWLEAALLADCWAREVQDLSELGFKYEVEHDAGLLADNRRPAREVVMVD